MLAVVWDVTSRVLCLVTCVDGAVELKDLWNILVDRKFLKKDELLYDQDAYKLDFWLKKKEGRAVVEFHTVFSIEFV